MSDSPAAGEVTQEHRPGKEQIREGLPGGRKTLQPRRSYADYLTAAPISLWEQDFSRAREYFERRKAEGVSDFRRCYHDHPEDVIDLSGKIWSCAVNDPSLEAFRVSADSQLLGGSCPVTDKDSYTLLLEQLIALAEEKYGADQEPISLVLSERGKVLHVRMVVPAGCEQALHLVWTAVIEISSTAPLHQKPGASEEKYRSLFESAHDAMLLADAKTGIVVEANRSAELLLGMPGRSIVGTPQTSLLPLSAEDGASGHHRDRSATFVVHDWSRKKVPVVVSRSLVSCAGAHFALSILHEMTPHDDAGTWKTEDSSSEIGSPRPRLTAREKEILSLIVSGSTNREIAARLSLSPKTVETHRSRSMRKLNLHNTASLVKYALRSGLE